MNQPAGHHLAEFNIGVLRYDWDDPRVADFADNEPRVNALAERAEGFVWRMNSEEMERAQLDPDGPLGGNPRTASTLSVWTDAASLEQFVWNTVHRNFYARRAEWYDATDSHRLGMWWVPEGTRPSAADGMARLARLEAEGPSEHAFGWSELKDARLWKTRGCGDAEAA